MKVTNKDFHGVLDVIVTRLHEVIIKNIDSSFTNGDLRQLASDIGKTQKTVLASVPATRMEKLEAMIDSDGLCQVLSDLAVVCNAKAEHIQHTWQDAPLAKVWEGQAVKIDKLAAKTGL